MKGKAAYAKARRQYKELSKRNVIQAETIKNQTAKIMAREAGCDLREATLRDQAREYAVRFGWGFWRRLAFAVTGK